MTALTDQFIDESYGDLLQVSNSNSGIDATLRTVSDGKGTDSILQLSTGQVNINATPGDHSAAPSLAIGVNSGIYESSANVFTFAFGGSAAWIMDTNEFHSDQSRGARLRRSSSTSVVPCFALQGDSDTGTGSGIADTLSGIAGGVEGWRLVEDTTISMHYAETATPAAIADCWSIYGKTDNKLYFQDGAGAEHEVTLTT